MMQKAKKALEKKTSQKSAPIAKPWPPAKDVQADVEFCFQSGLDRGEEMTMGKIYAELGISTSLCNADCLSKMRIPPWKYYPKAGYNAQKSILKPCNAHTPSFPPLRILEKCFCVQPKSTG